MNTIKYKINFLYHHPLNCANCMLGRLKICVGYCRRITCDFSKKNLFFVSADADSTKEILPNKRKTKNIKTLNSNKFSFLLSFAVFSNIFRSLNDFLEHERKKIFVKVEKIVICNARLQLCLL